MQTTDIAQIIETLGRGRSNLPRTMAEIHAIALRRVRRRRALKEPRT